MHVENGFIKIVPEADTENLKVEALFSLPFSLNEIEYGTCAPTKLTISASKPEHFQRGNLACGKQTTGLTREYWLNEKGELCYRMQLGADGAAIKTHLEACLQKT